MKFQLHIVVFFSLFIYISVRFFIKLQKHAFFEITVII